MGLVVLSNLCTYACVCAVCVLCLGVVHSLLLVVNEGRGPFLLSQSSDGKAGQGCVVEESALQLAVSACLAGRGRSVWIRSQRVPSSPPIPHLPSPKLNRLAKVQARCHLGRANAAFQEGALSEQAARAGKMMLPSWIASETAPIARSVPMAGSQVAGKEFAKQNRKKAVTFPCHLLRSPAFRGRLPLSLEGPLNVPDGFPTLDFGSCFKRKPHGPFASQWHIVAAAERRKKKVTQIFDQKHSSVVRSLPLGLPFPFACLCKVGGRRWIDSFTQGANQLPMFSEKARLLRCVSSFMACMLKYLCCIFKVLWLL